MSPKKNDLVAIEDSTSVDNRPFGRYSIDVEGRTDKSIVTDPISYKTARSLAIKRRRYGQVRLSLYQEEDNSPALD